MSKLIPFALAGVGATATSVGTTYLIKGTAGSVEQKLEFEDLSKFEEGFNNSKCVGDLFSGGVEKTSNIPDVTATSPSAETFFKTAAPQSTDPFKSCLKIEHKTTKYKDNKWTGKFTWTWTFIRGDEGFINFNLAETDDQDEGKLKLSGVFYLVGKKSGNENKWEIKHKKSSAPNKKIGSAEIDAQFPVASDDLKTKHKDHWGFFEDKSKLSDICRDSACQTQPNPQVPSSKIFSWTKADGGNNKKLSAWSKNATWWTNLYGDTHWSLDTKTSNFTGTWTEAS